MISAPLAMKGDTVHGRLRDYFKYICTHNDVYELIINVRWAVRMQCSFMLVASIIYILHTKVTHLMRHLLVQHYTIVLQPLSHKKNNLDIQY